MSANSAIVPAKPLVTRSTMELLLDLVEIKLGCVEVYDRDDARELKALQKARLELCSLLGRPAPEALIPAPIRSPRVARRGAAVMHA